MKREASQAELQGQQQQEALQQSQSQPHEEDGSDHSEQEAALNSLPSGALGG
jgi:hypothetical protein